MWANKNHGFTIVETLIVLAVSGVLFITTVLLISGQIERYRTRDAIINVELVTRDVLNDVATGYFPDAVGRGTSTSEVLAGKKITFELDGIRVETLKASAAVTGSVTNSSQVPSAGINLDEFKPYIWQIKPNPTDVGKQFYILFKNFSATGGDFISGAQDVVIYDSFFNPAVSQKICFDNGSKKSSITLAEGGGLNVKSSLVDSSGTC